MLTKKQKNLLLYINKKLRASGVSPSYEEMKHSLNLKSKSGRICLKNASIWSLTMSLGANNIYTR